MRGIGGHERERNPENWNNHRSRHRKEGILGGEEQLSSLRMLSNKVEDLD